MEKILNFNENDFNLDFEVDNSSMEMDGDLNTVTPIRTIVTRVTCKASCTCNCTSACTIFCG